MGGNGKPAAGSMFHYLARTGRRGIIDKSSCWWFIYSKDTDLQPHIYMPELEFSRRLLCSQGAACPFFDSWRFRTVIGDHPIYLRYIEGADISRQNIITISKSWIQIPARLKYFLFSKQLLLIPQVKNAIT